MTTQLVRPEVAAAGTSPPTPPTSRRHEVWVGVGWGLVVSAVAGFLIVVAHNAQKGATAARIKNPNVEGAPRPVRPLFGWTHWITFLQISTVVAVVAIIVAFAVAWRLRPKHPVLLMAIGYVMFYLAPFFPAIIVLRRLQRTRRVDSFVWRHPLLSLAVLIYAFGFVYDAVQEILLIRTGLYIYSQVIPFGSLFTGTTYQFPLLWESSLVTTVMIPAGILLYRDDTGRTVAEKLGQRIRAFRGREVLGTFVVMFLILNAAYLFLYGGGFAIMKGSGTATSVACAWPYPEAKVYDPQGYYAKAGQPGPYSVGIWSGWVFGQSGHSGQTVPSNSRCTNGG